MHNFKKPALSAAVAAAALSTQVQAAIGVDANGLPIIDESSTYIVYLSGASAARSFVEELITNPNVPAADAICDTSATTYKYKDSGNGKNQNAYLCVLNKAGNPALAGLSKDNLLLYKRSEGGSAQGVSPLIAAAKGDPAGAIEYLKIDASGCALSKVDPVQTEVTCDYDLGDPSKYVVVESDFGISDVDPGQFRGVNTPAGFSDVSADDVALLDVFPTAGLTFGIPVTTKLRDALQEAQFDSSSVCNPTNAGYTTLAHDKDGDGNLDTIHGETEACMPNFNSHQIASIYSGQWSSWDSLKVNGATLASQVTIAGNVPPNREVHVCRRVNGSGTQAQHNNKFLRYPCADAALTPASAQPIEFLPGPTVAANSSSGDLTDCLNDRDNGTGSYGVRWAVGIQSLEKNPDLGDDFRFVKVDGVAPTLQNTIEGRYKDWVELTFQYVSDRTWDAGEQTIADEVIKQAGNPVVLAALNAEFVHGFGASGFHAVPFAHSPEPNGAFNPDRPVSPYSHATTALPVDNCRVPVVYDGGDAQL